MVDTNRTLDWRSYHDPRSRNFGVREVLNEVAPTTPPRKRIWTPGNTLPLDQGSEGACVGFGWSGELASSPVRVPGVDNASALALYKMAQQLDDWPGENYSGTSVLAGAKAVQKMGHMSSYRWAFSLDDLRDAVSHLGPAVIGIPWYDEMYETRPSGLVKTGGKLVGGHCILVYGYNPKMRIAGEGWFKRYEVFYWMNSWGSVYGKNGRGLIQADDLWTLLSQQGEACIPLARS